MKVQEQFLHKVIWFRESSGIIVMKIPDSLVVRRPVSKEPWVYTDW